MNKQELIEKIRDLDKIYGTSRFYVDVNSVLELVELLDEPQKPVVPQFVADWYKNHKDGLEYGIWEYLVNWNKQQNSEFYEWMNHADNKPLQTLANMHQFGYEVEKEPRYTVKIKTVLGQYLGRYYLNNEELVLQFIRTQVTGKDKLPTFTQKELEEAGFGWVFSCEGIEIEEVTE